MGRLIRFLLFLIVLVVAIGVILPFVVPIDTYRGEIEARASQALGREVRIAGELKLSVIPQIGVDAEDVSIANVPGGKEKLFASIEGLSIGAKLWPLLTGSIEVGRLDLERPVIHLEVDRNGRPNWEFGKTEGASAPSPAAGAATSGPRISLSAISLGNGHIDYRDARSGAVHVLDDIDMTLVPPAPGEGAAIDGALSYNGVRLSITANVQDADAMSTLGHSPVSLMIHSAAGDLNFGGTLATDGKAIGALSASTPSVGKLIALTGGKPGQGFGMGAASLETRINAEGGRASLSEMKLRLDQASITGDIVIDTAPRVPRVSGTLDVGHLDWDKLGGGGAKPAAQAGASGGWSDAAIALDGLKAADANLKIASAGFDAGGFALGQGRYDLTLRAGVLTLVYRDVALYGGKVSGRTSLDASGRTPRVSQNMTISGVDMKALLAAGMGVDRITGTGSLKLDVSSQGASMKAIMSGLAGQGSSTVRDGEITGVDLVAVSRSIKSALTPNATGRNAKTPFSEAGGSFTLARGVLRNNDFRLINPRVRLDGNGEVDIGAQTINFLVKPSKIGGEDGTASQMAYGDIPIAFRIVGPWSHVSYQPDAASLATGIIQGVSQGGNPLDVLLGRKRKTDESAEGEPENKENKKTTPADILKGLLQGGN